MLKIFVEEAAALASLTLFVGMIAVWAQLFTQPLPVRPLPQRNLGEAGAHHQRHQRRLAG